MEHTGSVHNGEEHVHVHADGTVHAHSHAHTHQNTKTVKNRLARVIGHLHAVERMIDDGRDCAEVLVQIAAVRAAIENTGKVILQDHIQHCIVDAVEHDDEQALDALCQAIDKFVK